MDINKFITNFAEQFEDTDPSLIKADTEFRELEEWSSLTALSIIAMIYEEYDVTLSGNDVKNSNTVEDLYNAVKNKM